MRIYVDTANLDEIREWRAHPWVSGFTTNPTLFRSHRYLNAMDWAKDAVEAADGYPISIDGPPDVWKLGQNVWRKMTVPSSDSQVNYTAVCTVQQIVEFSVVPDMYAVTDVISVFAGRIMDTGRDPQPVIDAAKATGAQVLWASVREPYNIVQAEQAGCDIVTVPPTILRKWLDWNGKPLETVAAETIAQFAKDSEGLWTS
jgi:transaldolase